MINAKMGPVRVGGNHCPCLVSRAVTLIRLAAVGSAFAAGILLATVVLGAEPGPSARVAILSTNSTTRATPGVTNFVVAELQRLGYVEGRNLTIDFRSAEDKPARLPDLARELVRLKPDVILSMGTV